MLGGAHVVPAAVQRRAACWTASCGVEIDWMSSPARLVGLCGFLDVLGGRSLERDLVRPEHRQGRVIDSVSLSMASASFAKDAASALTAATPSDSAGASEAGGIETAGAISGVVADA